MLVGLFVSDSYLKGDSYRFRECECVFKVNTRREFRANALYVPFGAPCSSGC